MHDVHYTQGGSGYLYGLGRVGEPLLHIVKQDSSKAQLVVFVQQPKQGLLVLEAVLGLEGVLPVSRVDLWVVG
jgi:hypothetical protein